MKLFGQLLAASAIASLGLAAACKSETAPPDSAPTVEATASATATAIPSTAGETTGLPEGEPIDSGTIGGDGSELRLDLIDFSADMPFTLKGELSCSFIRTGDARPLLYATGFAGGEAERANGMVSIAGYPTPIVSSEDGGFNAIVDGGRFAGKGIVLDIRRGKAPMPHAGGESPPYPAAMKAMRADGAERSFNGTWNCGP
ncbi:hypothetical protein EKN06_06200 [Croceicoccus ponticola]|uniref:Uncharacterized protein n=1 Tax=Croceicoccus ponticola TaxID=2217664 RepID=A0A437GXX7_9SPHN|nr:hypothetical protein [Croceicoccus ponticola]RVQ67544.1 hypothetical protein EKN06_06200 [Croceicoccus ponticola]